MAPLILTLFALVKSGQRARSRGGEMSPRPNNHDGTTSEPWTGLGLMRLLWARKGDGWIFNEPPFLVNRILINGKRCCFTDVTISPWTVPLDQWMVGRRGLFFIWSIFKLSMAVRPSMFIWTNFLQKSTSTSRKDVRGGWVEGVGKDMVVVVNCCAVVSDVFVLISAS